MIIDGIKLEKHPVFTNYAISKCGKVYSLPRIDRLGRKWPGGWLVPVKDPRGYIRVTIYSHHAPFVHRLVLETYVGFRLDGQQCRHLNGNKQDNRIENLTWGTGRENQNDRRAHGTAPIGEQHPKHKLDESAVRSIFHAYHDGYYSQREIAKLFGVSQRTVCSIAKKDTWSHLWEKE